MGFALTPGEAPLHFSRSKNVMHVASCDARLSVGNLIALEGSINKDVGSAELPEKMLKYRESKYVWMKEFLSTHEDFDNGSVRKRAETLGKYMYNKIVCPVFV